MTKGERPRANAGGFLGGHPTQKKAEPRGISKFFSKSERHRRNHHSTRSPIYINEGDQGEEKGDLRGER